MNVNGRDETGTTPLMWASIRGHTQVVKLLLKCKDIQVDLVDNDGYQAMHRSADKSYPDITQLLLTHGVSVNVQSEPGFPWSGCTPLYLACECLRGETDKTPGSPTRDFTRCVQVLLDKGANVNLVSSEGWPPLHAVCRYGNNTDIVKLLISHGADVNKQTNDGDTPLILSCQVGFVSVVEILLQYHAKCNTQNKIRNTALIWASYQGHTQVVRLLLECKDIQVDLVDNGGFQAIHWSAQNGYPDITQLLLTHGASVNVQTEPGFGMSGCTPLYLSCECLRGETDKTPGSPACDFTRCAQVLLDKGANVNLAGSNGWTPLHSVCMYGNNTDIVELLISHGADVNKQNIAGFTPLILSCQEGFVSVVEILLHYYAMYDINVKNKHGDTALHKACQMGFDKCASLLLDAGADLSPVSNDNHTALSVAAESGHVSCVKLLLCRGAEVQWEGDKSPLHLAKVKGHTAVVGLLTVYQSRIKSPVTLVSPNPSPVTSLLSSPSTVPSTSSTQPTGLDDKLSCLNITGKCRIQ